MELFNLLEKAIPVFGQTYDVALNWIGKIVSFIVTGVSSVGVGIILFSLCLKLIVLPFDIYQRISMRKQNIKMEEQKERMEKLQKQYANNKEMYNQKLMEMYKENGISLFSSCLPMILSMVIFFVAIGAFNDYSQYANVQNYNGMVDAYNAKIQSYCPDLEDESTLLTFENETIIVTGGGNAYIYYVVPAGSYTSASDEGVKEYISDESTPKEYFIDAEKAQTVDEILNATATGEVTIEEAAYNYFVAQAQEAVQAYYEAEVSGRTGFLWIKNVWVTDASYEHPILTYDEFKTEASREKYQVSEDEKVKYDDLNSTAYTLDAYNLVTGKLTTQKETANGYFILIALSIATILLQQVITMRSQKAQNKYSTVDGQGASQQKMTMFMMTGMFAVFSFMYSSAFSLYMITSNVFSLISTVIINKLVDMNVAKKNKQAVIIKDNSLNTRIEAAKSAGKASAQESREKKSEKEENK